MLSKYGNYTCLLKIKNKLKSSSLGNFSSETSKDLEIILIIIVLKSSCFYK